MGDTITALPAFTAIKKNFPGTRIDLLTNKTEPGKAFINEILPKDFFSEYFYYEKFVDANIIKLLRENEYDLYIELPTYRTSLYFEVRSILVAKRINAISGIGWHISSDRYFGDIQERLFKFDPNRIRLLEILKMYNLNIRDTGWLLENNSAILPEYNVSEILNKMPVKQGVIALVTGAGLALKKWPLQNFDSVARHFSADNYLILLIGSKEDYSECESIEKGNENIINLCGKLTVLENAVIFKKCKVVISNDTGPMHLAYAVSAPVVALFNTNDYEGKWAPPEVRQNIIIRSKNKAMNMISVEEVINAANQILVTGKANPDV